MTKKPTRRVSVKKRKAARVKRPRNEAATDTTRINLRPLKARVLKLEDDVAILTSRVDALAPVPDEAA